MTGSAIVLICLMSATFPAVVRRLLPPVPEVGADLRPGVVVVPGAARRKTRGGWQPGPAARRRLKAGIAEARRRGLPLLVSGGTAEPSEAELMARLAERVAPDVTVIRETGSRNTWENAALSAALLARRRVTGIVLVTDRPHLPRATLCFRAQGLEVLPVASSGLPNAGWIPSTAALAMLPELWYEWAALFWYELKYF